MTELIPAGLDPDHIDRTNEPEFLLTKQNCLSIGTTRFRGLPAVELVLPAATAPQWQRGDLVWIGSRELAGGFPSVRFKVTEWTARFMSPEFGEVVYTLLRP